MSHFRITYTDSEGREHSEPASDACDAAVKAAKRTTDPACHDVAVSESNPSTN